MTAPTPENCARRILLFARREIVAEFNYSYSNKLTIIGMPEKNVHHLSMSISVVRDAEKLSLLVGVRRK